MQFGGQPTPWSEVEIEGLRLRSVSQILIQEIGAAGPENAEDSAWRACGVIQRQADQIVSADARIAELERNIERLDAQWREELRIYRETDGVDAERYRWLRNGRLVANSWGGIGIPMNYSPTEDDRLALDSTIDAARANGGEG